MKKLIAFLPLLFFGNALHADLSSSRAQNVISSATTITGPGGGSLPVVSTSVYKVSADTAVITDPAGFTILTISTITISSSTATGESNQIFASSPTKVLSVVINEGPFDIRLGPATSVITQNIGLLLKNGSSLNLDIPRYFRGNLFAISAGTAASKVSTLEGSP